MLTKALKTIRFKAYRTVEDLAAALLPPVLPFDYLEKRTRPPVMVPYYHIVSDERVEHVIQLHTYRDTDQFKADLDFFLSNYQPVEPEELIIAAETGKQVQEKAFLLTVDDGLREVHDLVAPILKQKGVPAVFFITTACLDNQTLGYRHKASLLAERFDKASQSPQTVKKIARCLGCADKSRPGIKKAILSRSNRDLQALDAVAAVLEVDFGSYLADVQPYLTSSQVRALVDDGFYIGAHSVDHFPYNSLTPAEQLSQTRDSAVLVKEKFGLDYSLFAFPFSDHAVRASLFEKLDGQIDLFFGTSAFCRDRIKNNIQRFWMEDTRENAESILKRLYARSQVRALFGLNEKKR